MNLYVILQICQRVVQGDPWKVNDKQVCARVQIRKHTNMLLHIRNDNIYSYGRQKKKNPSEIGVF